MAKVEQGLFILPKKRSTGKKVSVSSSYVDHIIKIQGVDGGTSKVISSSISSAPELGNGNIHSSIDGLKSNMKLSLPMITDVNEEWQDQELDKENEDLNTHNNGYQAIARSLCGSREVVDLSPIYENSSDVCSSHDDLQENQKSCKILNSEGHESSSATLITLSEAQSENSMEMGVLTDSMKSNRKKKRVNIISGRGNETDTEITVFPVDSESSISPDYSTIDSSKDKVLQMTGTIKRGKKKGQNIDVTLNISREELEIIEANIVAEKYSMMDISNCSLLNGPQIFIFTMFCMPIVLIISSFYVFYLGTLTWYNMFTLITEELGYLKKVFLVPLVILIYPFTIVTFTVGVGLYAAFIQLTFSAFRWWKEVCDLEKGFYGWLCGALHLSECSPYEVVVLTEVKDT